MDSVPISPDLPPGPRRALRGLLVARLVVNIVLCLPLVPVIGRLLAHRPSGLLDSLVWALVAGPVLTAAVTGLLVLALGGAALAWWHKRPRTSLGLIAATALAGLSNLTLHLKAGQGGGALGSLLHILSPLIDVPLLIGSVWLLWPRQQPATAAASAPGAGTAPEPLPPTHWLRVTPVLAGLMCALLWGHTLQLFFTNPAPPRDAVFERALPEDAQAPHCSSGTPLFDGEAAWLLRSCLLRGPGNAWRTELVRLDLPSGRLQRRWPLPEQLRTRREPRLVGASALPSGERLLLVVSTGTAGPLGRQQVDWFHVLAVQPAGGLRLADELDMSTVPAALDPDGKPAIFGSVSAPNLLAWAAREDRFELLFSYCQLVRHTPGRRAETTLLPGCSGSVAWARREPDGWRVLSEDRDGFVVRAPDGASTPARLPTSGRKPDPSYFDRTAGNIVDMRPLNQFKDGAVTAIPQPPGTTQPGSSCGSLLLDDSGLRWLAGRCPSDNNADKLILLDGDAGPRWLRVDIGFEGVRLSQALERPGPLLAHPKWTLTIADQVHVLVTPQRGWFVVPDQLQYVPLDAQLRPLPLSFFTRLARLRATSEAALGRVMLSGGSTGLSPGGDGFELWAALYFLRLPLMLYAYLPIFALYLFARARRAAWAERLSGVSAACYLGAFMLCAPACWKILEYL